MWTQASTVDATSGGRTTERFHALKRFFFTLHVVEVEGSTDALASKYSPHATRRYSNHITTSLQLMRRQWGLADAAIKGSLSTPSIDG